MKKQTIYCLPRLTHLLPLGVLLLFLLPLSTWGQAPASVLPDLSYFKLTFPLDANGNDYTGVSYSNRNNPLIKAWERDNLVNWTPNSTYSPYFFVSGNEVVFKAHCAGALTSANSYPRCELRETPNGTDDLWEFADEHELNAKFRITNLPNEKEEICVLQIKGNDSNNTSGTEEAFRLEYRQDGSQGVHVTINESTTLTDIMDYSLNQTIEARMYVNNGQITIELNNTSVSGSNGEWNYTYNSNYSHGYFKAGAYTQSSIWSQKNGVANESPTAYGEVRFSELTMGPSNTSSCTASTPSNRSTGSVGTSSATVSWNSVSNIDHYNVRWRQTGTSTWSYQYSIQPGTTSHTITGLNNNTTYEWQVRAKCPDNSASSYTSGQGPNFTTSSNTSCSPSVPANRHVDNIGTSSATLDWNGVANIDHYNVRWRKTGTSSWSYKYSIQPGTTSHTVTGLNTNTAYEWQVRAKCPDNSASSYESGQGPNFTTGGGGGNCSLPWIDGNFSVSNTTTNYSSGSIDISCASNVCISMDLEGVGNMETADYINVYYKVNGGSQQALSLNTDSFSKKTVSACGISGNTLEIIIQAKTSHGSEIYYITDIEVTVDGGGPPSGNLALNKSASQYNTAYGGVASRAVDGNTNGNWGAGSITHTSKTAAAWWEVDLGATYPIGDIVVWNRTNCCSFRLGNFTVKVENSSGNSVWSQTVTSAPSPSTTVNAGGVSGRYIRIEQNLNEPLSLAEVQVYASGSSRIQMVAPAFKLYPNPAQDILFMEFDEAQEATMVKLYAATGNEVMTFSVSGTKQKVNIRTLPRGVYFLKIQGQQRARKFVKQ